MVTFNYWLLNEAFDRETTQISRAIVQALTNNWNYVTQGHPLNMGAGDAGNAYINYEVDGIPISMDAEFSKFAKDNPIKNVFVTVRPHKGSITQKGVHVAGSYRHGSNLLGVNIKIGNPDRNAVMNELIVNLKNTIRHELEHLRQEISGNEYPPHVNLGQNQNYKDVQKYLQYLTHPAEIDANVAGIVKRAKMRQVPFMQALDQWLHDRVRLRMTELGHTPENAESVIRQTRQLYLNRFGQRYGGQQAGQRFVATHKKV